MKLNVTLKPTFGISSGFIIVVIFTRSTDALDSPALQNPFNINCIPTSSIVFSSATPAPILSNTPIVTPTLPVANYYGLMIGKSVSGSLLFGSCTGRTPGGDPSDLVPMTAEILNPSMMTSDSSACGHDAPYTMTFP